MSAKTAMHYDHTIWLKRIEAARASPFSVTLWLDNDAYPCVGGVNALWRQLAAHVDVVAAVAKEKFGGTGKASWLTTTAMLMKVDGRPTKCTGQGL